MLETDPITAPEERVRPDGDLARLLDGIDPFEFEKKKDGRLERKEMERAVFAALEVGEHGACMCFAVDRLFVHPIQQLGLGVDGKLRL